MTIAEIPTGYTDLERGEIPQRRPVSSVCKRVAKCALGALFLAGTVFCTVRLAGPIDEFAKDFDNTPSPTLNVTHGPELHHASHHVAAYAAGAVATAAVGAALIADAIRPGLGTYIFGGVICLPVVCMLSACGDGSGSGITSSGVIVGGNSSEEDRLVPKPTNSVA